MQRSIYVAFDKTAPQYSDSKHHNLMSRQAAALQLLLSLQADIFSYGVILWEIVTHEQPSGGNLRDCKVPQECPAEIDQLINQCLAQDPEARPTAKDIYETIRQWRVTREEEVKEARLAKEAEVKEGQLKQGS